MVVVQSFAIVSVSECYTVRAMRYVCVTRLKKRLYVVSPQILGPVCMEGP